MNKPLLAVLPPAVTDSWNWQIRAACRDLDPLLFFHPDYERGPTRHRRVDRAREVCAECPVRTRCLDHSVSAEEQYGVWGGMDEVERRVLIMDRHRYAREG